MRWHKAVTSLLLLTLCYLGALVWVDSQRQVFSRGLQLWSALPGVAALSVLSYVIRYQRWRWLLARIGLGCPWGAGFAAYLAGFMLTASPGKVGELVRIRYLARYGVPAWAVMAAFVTERLADLLVVLLLSLLVLSRWDILLLAGGFVMGLVLIVALGVLRADGLTVWSRRLWPGRFRRLAVVLRVLGRSLRACRRWLTWTDALVCLLLGLLAWGVVSWAFVGLCQQLGIVLPDRAALALYPLAMLAGAASMIPGGLGSTEATLVLLLTGYGVDMGLAALAAIGIRLGTLWLAIVVGGLAALGLEYHHARQPIPDPSSSRD